jgi:predicted HTH domain antitoxin
MALLSLQIPDEAFQALKIPPGRAEEELRQEFAVFLVKEGLLHPAQARTIAKMDRLAFQDLLARRQVRWGGSPEDALADLDAARKAIPAERS